MAMGPAGSFTVHDGIWWGFDLTSKEHGARRKGWWTGGIVGHLFASESRCLTSNPEGVWPDGTSMVLSIVSLKKETKYEIFDGKLCGFGDGGAGGSFDGAGAAAGRIRRRWTLPVPGRLRELRRWNGLGWNNLSYR